MVIRRKASRLTSPVRLAGIWNDCQGRPFAEQAVRAGACWGGCRGFLASRHSANNVGAWNSHQNPTTCILLLHGPRLRDASGQRLFTFNGNFQEKACSLAFHQGVRGQTMSDLFGFRAFRIQCVFGQTSLSHGVFRRPSMW